MGLTFLIPTKHKIVMPKGMKYIHTKSPLFILCHNIVHEENTVLIGIDFDDVLLLLLSFCFD